MREICLITSLAGVKDKGLWRLDAVPLMEWCIRTAASYCDKVVVSTDQPEGRLIAEKWMTMAVLPEDWMRSGDHHVEQALHALSTLRLSDGDVIHLMMPSSPFVRRQDMRRAVDRLATDEEAASVQTVIKVPHNFHAWNQREFYESRIDFVNRWERAVHKTKQTKPQRYAFGNLVSVRYGALKEQEAFFAQPSRGLEIPYPYGLDVDSRADLDIAHAYLSAGLVSRKEILT